MLNIYNDDIVQRQLTMLTDTGADLYDTVVLARKARDVKRARLKVCLLLWATGRKPGSNL